MVACVCERERGGRGGWKTKSKKKSCGFRGLCCLLMPVMRGKAAKFGIDSNW